MPRKFSSSNAERSHRLPRFLLAMVVPAGTSRTPPAPGVPPDDERDDSEFVCLLSNLETVEHDLVGSCGADHYRGICHRVFWKHPGRYH
eukprot:CAMPEP_0184375710 /NCGR_PEP_ID=MMETSP0007-20130409/795_1 /TAXON_ID=97485 /ORGANISM="Prymnesium parvum, Strain Texoma1" /LENGTH=88 /DNA_ID=CAMNT_0026718971 /DNA_START=347 /DNA_END=610 /DNA_ORIENTATION=+